MQDRLIEITPVDLRNLTLVVLIPVILMKHSPHVQIIRHHANNHPDLDVAAAFWMPGSTL